MVPPGANPQGYLRSAVLTANPEQLQLMLYDGAIRYALQGGDALRARNREAAFNAFDRAQKIVIELTNGLNREANPDVVDQMVALHNFVFRRLVTANVDADEAALEEAVRILRHQRETWQLVAQKVAELKSGGGAVGNVGSAAPPRRVVEKLVAGAVPGAVSAGAPAAGDDVGAGLHVEA